MMLWPWQAVNAQLISLPSSLFPFLSLSSSYSLPTSHTPFVGRERELAELRAGMEVALGGHGRVLLLAGEPGIGKTRTTEELVNGRLASGALVLRGRCSEVEGAPAYWPWIQIVRGYLRGRDPDRLQDELGAGAANIAQIVPEIGRLVDDLPALPELAPDQSRFNLFDAVTTFLKNAAAAQPLILALDDLHRADEPSLLLLRFLAREIQSTSLLIIGAYRDTEIDSSSRFEETLTELARTSGSRTIVLQRLLDETSATYIDQVADGQTTEALVQEILAATEGHPFYLAEVVRLLQVRGELESGAEQAGHSLRVPGTVHDAISQRLEQLSDQCVEVLTVAAVAGRDFSLQLLASVTSQSIEMVLDLLDEAVRSGIIHESETPSGYRFEHILIQQVIYSELRTGQRLRLHRDVGLAIEQLPRPERHIEELARHFGLAAPLDLAEQAIQYSWQAGDRAMEQLAWEVAIGHYRQALNALDLQPEDDPAMRCDLLTDLGIATGNSGDRLAAQRFCLEAIDLARTLNDPDRLARAAYTYTGGDHVSLGVPQPRAVELLDEALAALPVEDSALRVGLLRWLAGNLVELQQDFERQQQLTIEAIASARRLGNERALGQALVTHARVIARPDKIEELRTLAQEILELGERSGDVHTTVFGYAVLEPVAVMTGDRVLLDHCVAMRTRIYHDLGLPSYQFSDQLDQLSYSVAEGNFREAETIEVHLRPLGLRFFSTESLDAVLGMPLFPMRREQLRLNEVESIINSGLSHDPNYHAIWTVLQVVTLSETGREDQAQKTFESLQTREQLHPRNMEWFTMTVLLSDVAILLNDEANTERLYQQLIPYADLIADLNRPGLHLGSTAHYLGQLAAAMEHPDLAIRHFEDAIVMNDRMKYRIYAAWSRAKLGETLLQRDRPGDRERAAGLLMQAQATATEIGMLRLLNILEPLIQQADGAEDPSPAANLGLTPRQVEVLELIVEGNTDREIAEELYISRHTVMRHVSNILNTLGVDSRTAAAAIAVREDIGRKRPGDQ